MPGVKDRVALVTGAGRGIGKAAALLLHDRGARVMCVARSADELKQTGLPWVAADLGTPDGCELAVRECEAQVGPIDILVVNHGVGSAHERVVWEQDPDVWAETMRINLDGPFFLSRLALKGMVERRYGRIVFTSSTAGIVPEEESSAYNASKHGLIGLMRSIALDGGPFGVTSNAVLPGWVRTEMAERSAARAAADQGVSVAQIWAQRAAIYPAGRVVEPVEVAEAIAFFATEESSGVSGEALRVALASVV